MMKLVSFLGFTCCNAKDVRLRSLARPVLDEYNKMPFFNIPSNN